MILLIINKAILQDIVEETQLTVMQCKSNNGLVQ